MKIRLILGDQLNRNHSWFSEKNQEDYLYLMMEVHQETNYVKHHFKKIVAFFSAMRTFHSWMKKSNLKTVYFKINDSENKHSFKLNIQSIIQKNSIEEIQYQYPDEYRLYNEFKSFTNFFDCKIKAFETEHFYCSLSEIADLGKEKKYYLLENFYRYLRKKHQVLLQNDKPFGGKWNFDSDNRNKWKNEVPIPNVLLFNNDIEDIISDIKEAKIEYFGEQNSVSNLPNTREQALQQLDYFLDYLLPNFGTYQDAMHTEETMLFHSNLSFALNVKMLNPSEVIENTETYFFSNQSSITLPQVEGFIRQILGWREYVRMVYWNKFEDIKSSNFLENKEKLPSVFWTGKSNMNCVATCAKNSLDNAYAHHIQRLMVLGNFALLMQTNPDEVDDWYLGVYVDAIEWVQLPNTRGMSQFADGGIVATKPYISSANYIDKMSNYCSDCSYDRKSKYEQNSCPFNSLYWNFLDRNRAKFEQNQRMKMMYALWNKTDVEDKQKIIEKANSLIQKRDL